MGPMAFTFKVWGITSEHPQWPLLSKIGEILQKMLDVFFFFSKCYSKEA
jgi:hypothetical protein